ncbi:hypothetical protein HPB52_002852 [Rhipicephalus sanguineus]|uniref:Reductase n=1 Tax=Rhipicephalus sanguineus TaxID=34632 RepID=A0A9D4PTX8_RHISA|nr:hypothetical protein HPB52_002852 [Rhipicephalus sanguineus]
MEHTKDDYRSDALAEILERYGRKWEALIEQMRRHLANTLGSTSLATNSVVPAVGAQHVSDERAVRQEQSQLCSRNKPGASSGIGEATALRFASHGCWLTLTARNQAALESVADACRAKGVPHDKVLVAPGDITVEEDIRAVVEKTAKHFGQIDILVNTATPYCVAKAALDHLSRCAALENAPFGVRVNTVTPAVIKTPIAKHPGVSLEDHMRTLELTGTAHALGRPGTADEVARCIAFLASDDASFVTGITMPVDGGMQLLSSLNRRSISQLPQKPA